MPTQANENSGIIQIQNPLLRDGFSQLPNKVLKCGALSIGSRLLYSILLSYGWQEGSIFPGQERLAKDLGVSSRQVRNLLKELEKKMLVKIKRRGLTMTNAYILLDFYKTRPDLFPQNPDRKNISGQAIPRSPDGKIISGQGRKDIATSKRKEISDKQDKDNNTKLNNKSLELLFEGFKFKKATLGEILNRYDESRIAEVLKEAVKRKGSGEIKKNPEGWVVKALTEGWEFNSVGKRQKERIKKAKVMKTNELLEKGKSEKKKKLENLKIQEWIQSNLEKWDELVKEELGKLSGVLAQNNVMAETKAFLRVRTLIDRG